MGFPEGYNMKRGIQSFPLRPFILSKELFNYILKLKPFLKQKGGLP
jgi:hypothetical protein